uniref:tRNA (guanine(9)-N(1))-methyltransferase n=1 Tax=Globisporangium ultimum (strain ATCC 200006 / CBS 805.95 / DAOM BR144) TaxID=431595 RepID=K3WPP4_GLOUD
MDPPEAPVTPPPVAVMTESAAAPAEAVSSIATEVATNVPSAEDAAAPPTLPKRAARREKRRAYFHEKKEKQKLQKLQEKEEKRQKRAQEPQRELDMSEEAVLRRRERTLAKRETFLMAAEEGIKVVIDCGFEDEMESRAKKSLSQQIMYSYGVNRRSDSPATTYITSLTGETKDNLVKIGGFPEWMAFKSTPRCYIDLFKKESLVYLTADSPNTITKLSRDKVYIIGGIVDRNRLKGITYKKAQEQGIETAKLPLDQVVEMGGATRVLTVNHVFEILVQFAEKNDWAQAALSTLPSRKNAQLKQE